MKREIKIKIEDISDVDYERLAHNLTFELR